VAVTHADLEVRDVNNLGSTFRVWQMGREGFNNRA
jgi:hypothetical protein